MELQQELNDYQFWQPDKGDGTRFTLQFITPSFHQGVFTEFVGKAQSMYDRHGSVELQGHLRVSEQSIRYRLFEYSMEYIRRYSAKLPSELEGVVGQALALAFIDPENPETSIAIHFPFITETLLYKTIYRWNGSVNGEDAVGMINSLSKFIPINTIVLILEDLFNGTAIDISRDRSDRNELIRTYGDLLSPFLGDVGRHGSDIFGPVLAELIMRADMAECRYLRPGDGVQDTVEITTRREVMMDRVFRALDGIGNRQLVNSLLQHAVLLEREQEMDSYWVLFLTSSSHGEGTMNFIRSTFFQWDQEYKLRILDTLENASSYPTFQVARLHERYQILFGELLEVEKDQVVKDRLTGLQESFEAIDPALAEKALEIAAAQRQSL